MAQTGDDSDRSRRDETTNPFILFRRFADDQMSSLFNSVFGAFQSSPFRRQQAIDTYSSHTTDIGKADIDSQVSYNDFPIPFDWAFFHYNAYSPIILEQRYGPFDHAPRWRAAFEDLVHTHYGMDMPRPWQRITSKPFYLPAYWRLLGYNETGWARDMQNFQENERRKYITRKLATADPLGMKNWPGDLSSITSRTDDDFQSSHMPRQQVANHQDSGKMLSVEERIGSEVSYSDFPVPFDLSFFSNNAYSPTVVEKRDLFGKQGTKWRDAFEDLMYAHYGLDLPETDQRIRSQFLYTPCSWKYEMYNFEDKKREEYIAKELAKFDPPGMQDEPADPGIEESNATDELHSERSEMEKDTGTAGLCTPARVLQICDKIIDKETRVRCKKVWAQRFVGLDLDEGLRSPYPDCRARAREMLELDQEQEDCEEVEDDDDDEEDEGDENQDQMTELDVYTSPYHPAFKDTSTATFAAQQDFNSDQEDVTEPKPSAFSILTTTETRTLADGSRTTKVVLKKRFTDGVEETTERTYTQSATPSDSIVESLPEQSGGSVESTESKPREKKGWFWS